MHRLGRAQQHRADGNAAAGGRYQSKIWNPAFLRAKNLPVPAFLERPTTIRPPFVTA